MNRVKPDISLKLLNIGQVATTLGVSVYSIRSALARGAFPPPVQMSLSNRWAVSTIRDFAQGRWRPANPIADIGEGEAA